MSCACACACACSKKSAVNQYNNPSHVFLSCNSRDRDNEHYSYGTAWIHWCPRLRRHYEAKDSGVNVPWTRSKNRWESKNFNRIRHIEMAIYRHIMFWYAEIWRLDKICRCIKIFYSIVIWRFFIILLEWRMMIDSNCAMSLWDWKPFVA